jgi:hypothetical protein
LSAFALTTAGTSGTLAGVTLLEAPEGGPVPILFDAVTVNVYALPLLRLGTVIGLPKPVAVMPPGFAVTVQPVIWPPAFPGSLKLTDASE